MRNPKPKKGMYRYGKNREIAPKLYESGMTLQEVADKLDITKQRVQQLIAESGVVSVNQIRLKRMEAKYEEAVELYKSGLSARKIATRIGIHEATVLRYLHKFGVKLRPGGAQPSFDYGAALALYRNGKTVHEIAVSLGVADMTVWRALQKKKCRMRSTGPRKSV